SANSSAWARRRACGRAARFVPFTVTVPAKATLCTTLRYEWIAGSKKSRSREPMPPPSAPPSASATSSYADAFFRLVRSAVATPVTIPAASCSRRPAINPPLGDEVTKLDDLLGPRRGVGAATPPPNRACGNSGRDPRRPCLRPDAQSLRGGACGRRNFAAAGEHAPIRERPRRDRAWLRGAA